MNDCSARHRDKIKEGVQCCMQVVRNCSSCPYLGACDQLREDILRMIHREEIDSTDWSGFQGGF